MRIIRAICENPRDTTHVSLLYGNRSEEDILLRSELEEFQRRYPKNFEMVHVLSDPSDDWKGERGYVTKDMYKEKFPEPRKGSKALMCGPPGLVNAAKKSLVELGWDEPNVVSQLPDQVFSF